MNASVFNQYDADNARELCFRSAAAYLPPLVGGQVIESGDTSVSVWKDCGDLFVAFRGTVDLRNWLTDLDCAYDEEDGCHIHRGFARALQAIQNPICKAVYEAKNDGFTVWLTGHSLGGALAMLFAWRYFSSYHDIPFAGIYTFGQPRVGNRMFREIYDFSGLKSRTFRVIHANDLIPRVPWLLALYRHAGTEIFYPSCKPGFWLKDCPTLAKLPYDIRNAWRELLLTKIACLGDHHVSTYQALYQSPNAVGGSIPETALSVADSEDNGKCGATTQQKIDNGGRVALGDALPHLLA